MFKQPTKIYVDIESCHDEVKIYSCGKQYVGPDQIRRERNIIMIQYAFKGAKSPSDVHTLEWDWKRWDDRDRRLLAKFTKMCSKFEAIEFVTKNGKRFDLPYITGRLAVLGLPPLPDSKHTDLEQVMRHNMYLNSYKLDYVMRLFGHSGKVKMDRQDWFDIEERGDKRAMDKMRRYGKKDVLDTIKLEKFIMPYVPQARAHSLIKIDGGLCPHCKEIGVKQKMEKNGYRFVLTGRKQRWRCNGKKHPKNTTRNFTDTKVERE